MQDTTKEEKDTTTHLPHGAFQVGTTTTTTATTTKEKKEVKAKGSLVLSTTPCSATSARSSGTWLQTVGANYYLHNSSLWFRYSFTTTSLRSQPHYLGATDSLRAKRPTTLSMSSFSYQVRKSPTNLEKTVTNCEQKTSMSRINPGPCEPWQPYPYLRML